MQVVEVNIPNAHYHVRIERGLARHVAEHSGTPTAVALIVDDAIVHNHGASVQGSFRASGVRAELFTVHASEDTKSLSTVQDLCQKMLDAGLDRSSAVVAVGGGMVGDTAGFAAAVFMRGIACVQVPTTLLAMVDASIGGKTGVNLERAGGTLSKNQIGAFWQPKAVLCDPEVLRTLDARELRCGLAECVKHAVIGDPPLLAWIESRAQPLQSHDFAALTELVARSAAIKAAIVATDERESGKRALLNLGHTFAHAIEALDHANLKHGEAVSIGIVAAAHVAAELGVSADARNAGIARGLATLLASLGLPVRLPRPLPIDALMAAMRSDKKSIAGSLRLVVPWALGDVRVVDPTPVPAVKAAWRAVGAA